MGFNKVAVTRKHTAGWSRFWTQERTMSNSRLVSTALTWTFAIAAIYCSLFYVPAFYDFKTGFGLSSKAPQVQSVDRKFYSPAIDLLKQKQGFVMSGQAIEAHYKIDGNVSGNLSVYACLSPVIIEIFKCDPVIIKEIPLKKSSGKVSVRVNQNDFYGYMITLKDETADYHLAWRRVFY